MDPGALEVALDFEDMELRVDTTMEDASNPTNPGTSFRTPVFSTPLSQSASQVDRDERVGNESRVGLLLVLLPDDLCCGVVGGRPKAGGSTMWCTKIKSECRTKSHKSKVNLEPFKFYIRSGSGDKAFFSPSLDSRSTGIPAGERLGLGNRRETPVGWARLFRTWLGQDIRRTFSEAQAESRVSRTSDVSSPSTWEQVSAVGFDGDGLSPALLQSPPVDSSVQASPTGGDTPSSLGIETDDEDLADLVPAPAEVSEVTDDIRSLWVDTMAWNWNRAKDKLQSLVVKVEDNEDDNQRQLGDLFKELYLLATVIGDRGGVSADSTPADDQEETIWLALGRMRNQLGLMQSRMGGLEANQGDNAQSVDFVKLGQERDHSELVVIRTSLTNLANSYRSTFTSLNRKVEALSATQPPGRAARWDGGLGWESGGQGQSAMATDAALANLDKLAQWLKTRVGLLQEDVDQIGRRMDGLQVGREREAEAARGWGAGNLRDPIMIDETNTNAIALLEARLTHLEGHRGDLVFEGSGYRFASQNDVKRWIEAEQVESCGVHWDLFSILVRMGAWGESGKDRAQTEYMATKTNTTPLELDLTTSMGFDRPPLFFVKGSGEVDTLKISTHAEWIGKGNGVSFMMTCIADVTKMVTGIRGTIRHQKGDTRLAGYLLDSVERQFNRLTAFIGGFHQELTTIAQFPEKSAWRLIGRCLGGFFQSMVPIRSEVAMFGEYQVIDRKAHVIWTVLRCHVIIEQFVTLDFKGHTLMVQRMTLYMMTERVDPSQLAKLQDSVTASNNASAEATKQAKSVSAALAVMTAENIILKRTLGNLSSAVDLLKGKKPKP